MDQLFLSEDYSVVPIDIRGLDRERTLIQLKEPSSGTSSSTSSAIGLKHAILRDLTVSGTKETNIPSTSVADSVGGSVAVTAAGVFDVKEGGQLLLQRVRVQHGYSAGSAGLIRMRSESAMFATESIFFSGAATTTGGCIGGTAAHIELWNSTVAFCGALGAGGGGIAVDGESAV